MRTSKGFGLRGLPRTVALLIVSVFAAFPVYWMLTTATRSGAEIYGDNPPIFPTLGHFGGLLADSPTAPRLLRWLGNSFIVAVGTSVLSLLLAVFAAYALSRYKFRGKSLVSLGLFATQMLPEALLIVPMYAIFLEVGLLNNLWSLVLGNTAFSMPVAVWILKSGIDRVPIELEEAARVDGCGTLTIMKDITLPLVRPALATAGVLTFFHGWNEFLFANTFISDERLWPASKGLASFIGEFITPLDAVMAAAIAFAAPAVVFFVVAQRGIISGLSAGAVKG